MTEANAETKQTPAQLVLATAATLGITMTTQFVPWSQSRNRLEKSPSLNWVVTLHKTTPGNGHDRPAYTRAFLTTDYGAGCGHCPAYKASIRKLGGQNSVMRAEAIKWECENGKTANVLENISFISGGKALVPELADVLSSLVMDSDVLNYSGFEDWASNFGYEPDSRKAEATYQACLKIALEMRNAIGEQGLQQLRDACQDY